MLFLAKNRRLQLNYDSFLNFNKNTVLLILFLLFSVGSFAQLRVSTNRTIVDLVTNVLASKGVYVDEQSISSSANLKAIGFFDGRNSNIGIDSGILLSTGLVTSAIGPNLSPNTGTSNNQPGDINIKTLNPDEENYDAAWISFRFTPESDTLKFRIVFASEEYPEYVGQAFNDLFGLFIQESAGANQATNLALIPGTNIPISIKSINPNSNAQYYIDNSNGTTVSFDGFTTIFEIKTVVVPCKSYTLKFCIADLKDYQYDSGIFIEALSLKSINQQAITAVASKEFFSECDSLYINFIRNSDDVSLPLAVNYTVSGSAVNTIDYTLSSPNEVIIPAGKKSAFLKIKPFTDGIAEPSENIVVKIINPVICDTQSVNSILLDYKQMDSLDFDFVCGDSVVIINVLRSDDLDSIKWYNSDGKIISLARFAIRPIGDTSYVYISSYERCTGKLLIDSTKIMSYTLTTKYDSLVCLGDTIFLNVSSNLAGAKYEWNTSTQAIFYPTSLSSSPYIIPQRSGGITVRIINDGVCAQKSMRIEVVVLGIKDTVVSLCETEDTISFYATGGAKYQWTPSDFLSSDTVANPVCSAKTNMSYQVKIDNGECSETFNVRVNIDTAITIKANEDVYICSREFAALNAEGSPNETYSWLPTSGLDSPNIARPRANPIATTTYYVLGYNGNCVSVDSVTVFVVEPISNNIEYAFDSCSRTLTAVQLDATTATDVYWDLGNGTNLSGKSIQYQFPNEGDYQITSYINKLAPCIDSGIFNVSFSATDASKRRIPQAFSPNGDGVNDEFKVQFGNIPCKVEYFKIFNRWGQQVFEAGKEESLSWDGKLNGQPCEPGVYVYHLKGDGFENVGWIALVK